jgi:hypothetical protein
MQSLGICLWALALLGAASAPAKPLFDWTLRALQGGTHRAEGPIGADPIARRNGRSRHVTRHTRRRNRRARANEHAERNDHHDRASAPTCKLDDIFRESPVFVSVAKFQTPCGAYTETEIRLKNVRRPLP